MRFSHPTHGHDSAGATGAARTAITAEVLAGRPVIPDRTSPRRSSFPAITVRAGVTSAIAVATASAATASLAKDAVRRRRVFDSGELQLVLLKLIADQPATATS